MSPAELVRASRHERALYKELAALYAELSAALAPGAAPAGADWLADRHRRADATTEALRAIAAALAPHRFGGGAVPAEVRELWSASAALAARAADANRELAALAQARRRDLVARLAHIAEGRHALTRYRPRTHSAAGLTARRA